MNKSISVLFICMGNICRSPTAHAVFQSKINECKYADHFFIDSAGTHSYHSGSEPDQRSQAVAANHGYDLSALRARQIEERDGERFDYILVMDSQNMIAAKQIIHSDYHHKFYYFLDFADSVSERDVPDPYYGQGDGFRRVLEMVEKASDGFISKLLELNKDL